MKYRTFGTTGWQVSEISFGGWQLGGQWGAVDDEASIASLLHAFQRGVNFVDTAEYYGDGHSEHVIGEALRRWAGDKIYVATKVRPVVWPSPDEDDPQMRGRYPEWYLRSAVEESLERFGVERLNLFQLHGCSPTASGLWTGWRRSTRCAGEEQGRPDRRVDPRLPARGGCRPGPLRAGRLTSGCLRHLRAAPAQELFPQFVDRTRVHRAGTLRLRFADQQLDRERVFHLGPGLGPAWLFRGERFAAEPPAHRGPGEGLLRPTSRRFAEAELVSRSAPRPSRQ